MEAGGEIATARARLARVRGETIEVLAAAESIRGERPSDGGWSVGECALHVLETNGAYLSKAEAVIARERSAGRCGTPPFRYGRFARWFAAQMEPGTRSLSAPGVFRPKERTAPPDIAVRLEDSFERLDRALLESEGLDLAKAKVATPVAPLTPLLRFPLGVVLPMLVAHAERHLRQMERVATAVATSRE